MAAEPGSRWMLVSAQSAADYYPTDGVGGIASADIANSDLNDAASWTIDSIMFTAINTSGTETVTIKDAGGTTIHTLSIASTLTPIPYVIDFGTRGLFSNKVNSSDSGDRGFTVNPSSTDFTFFVFYSYLKRDISLSL